MSKANVAHFIKRVSESPDLNSKVSAAQRTPEAWVTLGKSAGFEYSASDVVAVLSELSGRKLSANDAVSTFFSLQAGGGELSDDQLSQVAGGAAAVASKLQFSPSLFNRLSGLYGAGGPVSQNFSERVPGGTFFVKSGGAGNFTLPGAG